MNKIQLVDEINNQKAAAKELLSKLEIIDPHCILAGGAPRNWFLGLPARDLDFYIHLNETQEATERRFKRLNLEAKLVDYNSETWADYGVMEHLFRIYEVTYKDMEVQIMCMRESTFKSVVPCMGVSVCKFWWKGGEVIPTNEALTSIYNKTLYVKDDYSAKEDHVKKMIKYFPDFEVKQESLWKRDFIDIVYLKGYYGRYQRYYDHTLYNKVIDILQEGKYHE